MLLLRWTNNMPGQKPYLPTEEQRRVVKAMAGYGVPHDDIARVVRCSASRPPDQIHCAVIVRHLDGQRDALHVDID